MNFNTGQLRLLPISQNKKNIDRFIQGMRVRLKSWSHYIDFPIYGGALKKNGEVLFWSRGISRDLNDLKYLFLIDITRTNFQSSDENLSRDISYNFPNILINNSI